MLNKKYETYYRRSKETDAKQIASIHIISWQTIYRGLMSNHILDNLTLEKREIEWQERLKTGMDIWVIEYDEKIIGFSSTCPSRDEDTDPTQVAEISAIYLLPKYWRQSFGQQLCEIVCDSLKKKGYKEIMLWVLESNIQACRFYEKIGFHATGHAKTENLNGEFLQEVRYKKILNPT